MEMLGSYGFIASGDVAPFHMRLTGALNGQKTGVFLTVTLFISESLLCLRKRVFVFSIKPCSFLSLFPEESLLMYGKWN